MSRGNRGGWNMRGGYGGHGGYNTYMEQNPGFGGGYGSGGSGVGYGSGGSSSVYGSGGSSSVYGSGGSGGQSFGGQTHGYGDEGYGYGDGMGLSAIQEEQNMLRNKLAMANNLLQQQTQLLEEVGMQVSGGDRGGGRRRGRGLMGDMPSGYMGPGFGGKRPGSEGYGFGYDPKRKRMEMSFGSRGGRGRGRDRGRSRAQVRKEARGKTVQKKKEKEEQDVERVMEPYDPTKNSVSYCHVCHYDLINLNKWKAHIETEPHMSRMAELEGNGEEASEEEQKVLEKIKHQTELREKQSWTYCESCDKDTVSSLLKHKGSPQHEYKLARCKNGCKWCEIQNFKNFTEVLEHRATEQHIKERIRHTGKRDMTIAEEVLEFELAEFPEFQSGKQVGSEYVVPVTGYLCKLCERYYPSMKTAKLDHCNSRDHYTAYKKAKTQSLKDNLRNVAMKARFVFKNGDENRYMTGREYENDQLKENAIDFDRLEQEVKEEMRLEEEERKRQEEEDEKLRQELEAAKRLMASNGVMDETQGKEQQAEEGQEGGQLEEDMEAQDEDN
ncbi:glutamic acid-rich protein-like isoform X2 [Gigantopelta aegis]|uniref:glutamic acid-rich protein-like isoform X2 n=1 Tax=Gigantopelta aegis TaxID=1735272 RepID=UPI001B888CB0|nr:glutamic acid-rich protein-like isoform X2 [Gigantopelta aegis]